MVDLLLRRKKLGLTSCKGISASSTEGLIFIRNDKPFPEDVNFVFRWGTTSIIPTNIKAVVNTAKAIHRVNNKMEFRRLLQEADAKLVPKTFFSVADWIKEANLYGQIIVRPRVHSRGKELLYYTLDQETDGSAQLDNFIKKHPEYYISEYIPKIEEYRVAIVQGRVVWIAKKTPANHEDIAWNVAKGGRFDNVRFNDWPLKAVKYAIKAFNLSKLDFGGVDIMIGPDGQPYILEINSAPSLTSPYRQQCMAKAFDYIINNGKKQIPLVNNLGDWKKFIHPAISDRALLVE